MNQIVVTRTRILGTSRVVYEAYELVTFGPQGCSHSSTRSFSDVSKGFYGSFITTRVGSEEYSKFEYGTPERKAAIRKQNEFNVARSYAAIKKAFPEVEALGTLDNTMGTVELLDPNFNSTKVII